MIETFVKEFMEKLKYERSFSKHTLRAYHTDLTQFDSFLKDEKCKNLKRVNHLLLRKYLAALRSRNYSRTTIVR